MLRHDAPGRRSRLLARLLVGGLLLPPAATAASPDKDAARNDALVVLHAVIRVTTSAEYCNKFIHANPRLLQAALQWNGRQRAPIERVAAVIERAGGLSQREKDASNEAAAAEWKALDAGHCNNLLRDIESGALDLDKQPDTAAAIKRIMGAK